MNFFTTKNIIIYFIIINIVGFLAMGIDKKRAKMMEWRIPEKTLFLITLFGGGIGTISGMYTFRHKTSIFRYFFENFLLSNKIMHKKSSLTELI